MRGIIKLALFGFIILLASSCKLKKKLVYFQDKNDLITNENLNYNPKIKVDDLLNITVLDMNQENNVLFNGANQAAISNLGGYAMGMPALFGYLVDNKGEVDLPVVGKVKVEGLTRTEAVEFIQQKLQSYLTSPIVKMNILNYKVTVLGDVRMPGTYRIPNERITILEAIGLAGDLNMTAKRDKVVVIRENKEGKKKFVVDLRTMDLLSSPVYYLEQNDVVYIEPNFNAMTNNSFFKSSGGQIISVISLMISTAILITR